MQRKYVIVIWFFLYEYTIRKAYVINVLVFHADSSSGELQTCSSQIFDATAQHRPGNT